MTVVNTTPDPAEAPLTGLGYACLLAHKLARITGADAFVINDRGHPMLACAADIGADASALRYWTQDQIIFRAPAPE